MAHKPSNSLPECWVETKLENVVDILDNMRKPVNNKERQSRIADKSESELFPYYGATGQAGFIDDFLFDEELVALGEDGVPFFDGKKTKAYMLHGKTWVNNHAHVIRGGEFLPNKLLCYYLNQFDYHGYVNGGTRLKLTQANMRKMPIFLAPLPEQKRIVEKLDSLLAQVDTIQQRLNNLPGIIKRFRQSVLAAAVSGKLTEQWRGENNVTTPNIEVFIKYWSKRYESLGLKFTNPKLNSKTEDIKSYPETWLNTQLGNVFDVYVGSTPSRKNSEYWAGEVPWVSSGEVAFCRISSTKEKITELGLSNASTKLHPIGTVMLAMIGQGKTRGQPAILDIEAAHNQNTAALRIPDSYCVSEYLYFYLSKQYEETRMVGAGNNQKALNKKSVQSLNFACPPKEEQTEIVRLVEQYFALADTLEKNLANAKQRVDNLTQSILAKAFRGELVPQDPNDEPADKLLARIKAARIEAEKLEKAAKISARKATKTSKAKNK